MFLQRYDTYVGTGHGPEMLYIDKAGLALLDKQKNHEVASTGDYLEPFVTHPVVMGGLALSHLINGLDQRYDTPYISRLDTGSHRPLRIAGFLITFLALLRLIWPAARRRLADPLALPGCTCTVRSHLGPIGDRDPLPATALSFSVTRSCCCRDGRTRFAPERRGSRDTAP